MARAPEWDPDEPGSSVLDYWPAMFGTQRLEEPPDEEEPANAKRAPSDDDDVVFIRRDPPPTPETRRWRRRLIHAYNAWVAAGHLPAHQDTWDGEAVMRDWKAFRERYLALEVVDGGAT